MVDPSWMELKHFLNFLNAQFEDCEKSMFCNMACIKDELPGFKAFVIKFMLKMAKVSQVKTQKPELNFTHLLYTYILDINKYSCIP